MKYGYVYVTVGIAIVTLGIFLIYELGLKQETLQNKDELQHLQTTEIVEVHKPQLSQAEAFQIVKSDILNHVPTIDYIKNSGDPSTQPNFTKFPIRLIYENPDGQFLINNTDYSIAWKCDTKNTFCIITDDYRIQKMNDKLVYYLNVDAYVSKKVAGKPIEFGTLLLNYLVDARNGDIIYSDLSRYVSEFNQTGDWITSSSCLPKDLSQMKLGFPFKLPTVLPDGYSLQGIDTTHSMTHFYYSDHSMCVHSDTGAYGIQFVVTVSKESNTEGHAIFSPNGTIIGYNETHLSPMTSLEFQQAYLKSVNETGSNIFQKFQTVDINSYKGLEIESSTPYKSGIMFLNDKDQVLYGVGGNFSMNQLLAVARSIPP